MNYIELINQFHRLFKVHKFTGNESLLYFGLLNKCNSLNWKNPFRESERHLSATLGMSVNTVRKSRTALIEYGLIELTQPEKASKSIEGSAIYLIVQNVSTASKIDTVHKEATASKIDIQPLQNLTQTASKIESQPLQKLQQTINSSLNLQKTSFYTEIIKKNYEENELNKCYNNIIQTVAYHNGFFRDKTLSGEEFVYFLQNYFPEEIDNAIYLAHRTLKSREYFENLSIPEMLDIILPYERSQVEDFFKNNMKKCTGLLGMKNQLTVLEKLDLINHAHRNILIDAIKEVEDKPKYRSGNSVFLSIKKNLDSYDNWKHVKRDIEITKGMFTDS
jgi:hypothetical protein